MDAAIPVDGYKETRLCEKNVWMISNNDLQTEEMKTKSQLGKRNLSVDHVDHGL